ncbi:uncharacterized protein LOC123377543 [Mauremys mutica]|uniref:uncharacterized protein LOC123377543 n=1 Tax=Mauremys mutica TaxID=74926 RepID=UPI001D16105C|nr:uncharacterized protein LOC123377543 [Mauremys mutica]
MTTLVAKLTGRALDIFSKMPIDDASNYGKFKELLLKQFQITPETYRVKFRSLKRGSELSNVAYVNEMRDLLDKSVRGKDIISLEEMCDLVTQEQFLNMCSDDVKQCLWDKKVDSVGELAGVSDSFEQSQAAIKHKPLAEGYRVGGKHNHCFTPGKKESGCSPPHSPITRPKSPVQAEEPKRCDHCKSTEHLRNKCPWLSGNRHQVTHEAAASQSTGISQATASYHTGFVKVASIQPSSEHTHTAKLNDKVLQGWRDTGAEICVIKRDLIQEKDLLPGKTAELELVEGYKVLAPLAQVYMETGDLEAELTVAAVAHNFAPFLMGNDFFNVAESIPGFVSSKKESCAEIPRGEGEVTCAAEEIGECLFNSLVAVENGLCSPGAQGRSLQERLDRVSSCPMIISLGEGDVPPCNREAFPAAECQEVAGQQGTVPALGCTETCIPEIEVGVLMTAAVGADPKGSVAGSKPNMSERMLLECLALQADRSQLSDIYVKRQFLR